ncbi:MAG TPA: C4-type zinc ribbon domain-containing protein [Candidatus Nanopelagicaceae bacterium]|nr:C4-type zinc ribbon domain-containing protein [Candidatus Nanopelagicaceae bacterium]
MNASAADQARLLEISKLDQRLSQLNHSAKSLPEHDQIAAIDARAKVVGNLIVAAQTECSDIGKEVARAEVDVEQVRARISRDENRLNSGQGTPKELEAMQHEIATLARRQAELEDVELEILERLEQSQTYLSESQRELSELDQKRTVLETSRDAGLSEILKEASVADEMRGILATQIDAAFLALYAKISGSVNGIGAAELHQRKCQGCRLEINATDIGRFREAPEDEVLRCEECRRILIRTSTSGL